MTDQRDDMIAKVQRSPAPFEILARNICGPTAWEDADAETRRTWRLRARNGLVGLQKAGWTLTRGEASPNPTAEENTTE